MCLCTAGVAAPAVKRSGQTTAGESEAMAARQGSQRHSKGTGAMDHEPHHGSRRHSKGTGTGSRAPPRLKTALQGRHCPWIMSPNMAHDGIPGAATMAHDGTTTTT